MASFFFLKYFPKIIVLTNIEREHLDYYKNLNKILQTFRTYIRRLPQDGILVANWDDKNIQTILSSKPKFKVQRYSLKNKEAKELKKILKIPGEHNVSNALAALSVARILKIPDKIAFQSLSGYKSSWRRFEITKALRPKSCTVISDYAHHPTEIKVTLQAAREKFPEKKIWCVFQPHQYQRTFYLFKDFAKVLSEAHLNKLIITDIYDVAGRENKNIKKKVSSKTLVNKIKNLNAKAEKKILYIPTIEEAANYLRKNLADCQVLIIMGAGDIYKLGDFLSLTKSNKKRQ